MISKEEFLSIPKISKELKDEQNRIAVMRSKLYSPRGLDTSDKVQSSGSQTALADIVIDMEGKLDNKELELRHLQDEARCAILGNDTLSNDEVMLMLLRYTEGASWQEISETIHYSIAQVFRYHRIALDILFDE